MKRKSIHKKILLRNNLSAALHVCENSALACCLVSNNSNPEFELLLAISYNNNAPSLHSFNDLKDLISCSPDYYFGHFSYNLKEETHGIESKVESFVSFPALSFFCPEVVVKIKGNDFKFLIAEPKLHLLDQTIALFNAQKELPARPAEKPLLHTTTGKEQYIDTVSKIKQHIYRGDIYETNYCIEFTGKSVLDPSKVFSELNAKAQSPFSCFYKTGNKFVLCASPERFIKKENTRLISQPIKGTSPRGNNTEEDLKNKEQLLHNQKERNENVMIVDLVRNDLSISAKKGTVKVDELFGIYSFNTVHQMISTVSCEIKEGLHPVDAIKNAFPMGSMTGAPKKSAILLMDKFEKFNRGIYSGSIGYFDPNGNFDFNVVIRSILYDQETHHISIAAGSAITALCESEKEYEECLLKLNLLMSTLNAEIN